VSADDPARGTAGAQILVIEDEADIRRFLRLALASQGHEVHEATTMERGLIEAAARRPDLVVVDLGLPDGDGIGFIVEFRRWSAAPVLVLSARTAEAEKIRALDAGADDYLVKPFGPGELLARARAHLRRRLRDGAGEDAVLEFGSVRIDRGRRSVLKGGEAVRLTPIEYRLLSMLTAQPGRVITHRRLLEELWGPHHRDDVHYVRVHMGNLRKKIEDDPSRPRWLLTETGVGYRFADEAA
jgi:two-component system, OmpR family, KDP operon response regulator KdpE